MPLDVMVDLETTGLPHAASQTAIIQIAAVQFNLETGEVFTNFFDRCLMIPPDRFWQEGTRGFWASQNREVFEGIMNRAEDPAVVMRDFHNWCMPTNSLRFWAKPTHFEFPFLSSYFNDYGHEIPFHYRHATDMNSFIRGLWFPNAPPPLEQELEFDGDAHNALFDVLHQIKTLLAHVKQSREPLVTPPVIDHVA